jgi:hypothetical protein
MRAFAIALVLVLLSAPRGHAESAACALFASGQSERPAQTPVRPYGALRKASLCQTTRVCSRPVKLMSTRTDQPGERQRYRLASEN